MLKKFICKKEVIFCESSRNEEKYLLCPGKIYSYEDSGTSVWIIGSRYSFSFNKNDLKEHMMNKSESRSLIIDYILDIVMYPKDI